MNNMMNEEMHAYNAPNQYTAPLTGGQVGHGTPRPRNNINAIIDEDALMVLGTVPPELKNAFISIAIKHLQYDTIYETYFKKYEEIQDQYIDQEIQEPVVQEPRRAIPGRPAGMSPGPAVPTIETPPQQASTSSGFTDW